ncbi:MAG: aspartyl/asparaginyl beta-hydroxylase domain-containing protein [Brevundimonas sp.]
MSSQETPEQASLLQQASQALAQMRPTDALALIDQADALGATHNGAMNRALALRLLGRFPEAVVALDEALAFQPYDFVALLAKAAMLERLGQAGAAADLYRNALKISPPRDRCSPALLAQLDHASALVHRHAEGLRNHMQARVAALRSGLDSEILERFDEGLEIYAGLKSPPKQEPLLLNYPRLPAIPFHDRRMFPWLEELEAATSTIRAELEALLTDSFDAFAPYIAFPKGAPVNQWGELNHSRKWTSLWLWKNGEKQEAVCARCPETAALLERLPMARQSAFAPTAVFSALQPHTHIPPHTGSTNVRLLCHLPLILPGSARFRVGNTTRDWKMGKAWVFDDTIEHEAWNGSDELRTIMIADIWSPFLSPEERAAIASVIDSTAAYQGVRPGPDA